MRVYIQQNCISHYREAIFELLSSHEGIEFTVIADSESDTPFLKVVHWDTARIRHRYARRWEIKIPSVPAFSWQPHVLTMIIRDKPDLVIAMGTPYSLTTWAVVMVARFLRLPVLLWGHGLLQVETGAKWLIRKVLYSLASGQLLYGNHAKQLLINRGLASDNLHVVFNSLKYDQQLSIADAVSPKMIAEFRRTLDIGDDERLVVFTGRLQPVKRLDLLLYAIKELALRGYRVHIVLVGDGSERKALAELAQSLEIASYVHFLGAQYDEEFIGLVLSASNLSVVPSGAGLSVIHALSFGTPVILHDRIEEHFPEWEAVQEGITGFFYKFDNSHDLSIKIERALFPYPCKTKMASACRTIIRERYNPYRQVEIIENAVMQTLCATNGRAPLATDAVANSEPHIGKKAPEE
jgi:glycosyltransferase involved in cell wall biosynthesis